MSHDVGRLRSFEIDMFTLGYATSAGPIRSIATHGTGLGGVFGTVMFVMINPSAGDAL